MPESVDGESRVTLASRIRLPVVSAAQAEAGPKGFIVANAVHEDLEGTAVNPGGRSAVSSLDNKGSARWGGPLDGGAGAVSEASIKEVDNGRIVVRVRRREEDDVLCRGRELKRHAGAVWR